MSVAKWKWTEKNPSKYHPYVAGASFNATAAQNQAAYQALLTKGPVVNFNVSVWNDLCGKILDLHRDWQSGNPFDANSPVWIKNAKKDLTAEAMNRAVSVMYGSTQKPWVAELGREYLRKNDRVRAAYFFWIVEVINHWCELTPLPYGVRDRFAWGSFGKTALDLAIPTFPEPLRMLLDETATAQTIPSYPFSAEWDFFHNTQRAFLNEPQAVYIASPMNFSTLNIRCCVWAKNMIILVPEILAGQCVSRIHPLLYPPRPFSIRAELYHHSAVSALAKDELAPFSIWFSAQHGNSVLPDIVGITELGGFTDNFAYDGKGRIRTRRPIPFSALTPYTFTTSAYISHEGVELLDMASDILRLLDQFELEHKNAASMEQEGEISIRDGEIKAESPTAHNLQKDDETIVMADSPAEFRSADAVIVAQTLEKIRVRGDTNIQKSSITAIGADGTMQNFKGGGDMTFANEESIVLKSSTIAVKENMALLSDSEASGIDHSGAFATESRISLQETTVIELAGENTTEVRHGATLQRNPAYEAESEVSITAAVIADLQPSAEAGLSAEVIAARTKISADVVLHRFAKLLAENTVSTKERAVLEAVIRKLLSSDAPVTTKEYGTLLNKLIHFLESNASSTDRTEGVITKTHPSHMKGAGKAQPAVSAFLDKNYSHGDNTVHEGRVSTETDATISTAAMGKPLTSAVVIQTIHETLTELIEPKRMESGAMTSVGSTATIQMARSERILAAVYEDTLASDLDAVLATDVERHLIIN